MGRRALNVLKKRQLHQATGICLVAITTFVILVSSFSNIGGPVVLAVSNTPKPVIDATTKSSVQIPLAYESESRGFSWFHAGADLAAPTGTPVKSIMAGTVRAVNQDLFGYGKHIIVIHDQGFESLYAHLSKINVELGQKVELTTEIGQAGSTGFSTGPHLHLEVRQNGSLINPADIVPGVN